MASLSAVFATTTPHNATTRATVTRASNPRRGVLSAKATRKAAAQHPHPSAAVQLTFWSSVSGSRGLCRAPRLESAARRVDDRVSKRGSGFPVVRCGIRVKHNNPAGSSTSRKPKRSSYGRDVR